MMNMELRPSAVTSSGTEVDTGAELVRTVCDSPPLGSKHAAQYSIRRSVLRHPGITAALVTTDFVAFWLAVSISALLFWLAVPDAINKAAESGSLTPRLQQYLYFSIAFCLWSAVTGAYTSRRALHDDAKYAAGILTGLFFLDVFLQAISLKQPVLFWSLLLWPCAAVSVVIGRVVVRRVLDALGAWRIGAAVLGSGEQYESVMDAIEKSRYVGYYAAYHAGISAHRELPLSEFADRLAQELEQRGAETAVIVPSAVEMTKIDRLIDALNLRLKPYILVPPVQRVSLAGLTVQTSMASDAILMSSRHGLMSPVRRTIKRVFDIAVSLALLVFLAPALIAIALTVAASGRPILYGHERIGRGRKPFRCLKFRTMVVNSDEVLARILASDPDRAEEWRQSFKLVDDPRITRVGKFLRKTSLDELPQLLNVLRGDMSLVGPRPVVAKEIKFYYGEDASYYELVRPGVTGLWQVSGRSTTTYSRRVFLDSCYVRNWSLWADLMILCSTIPSVIARDGAH